MEDHYLKLRPRFSWGQWLKSLFFCPPVISNHNLALLMTTLDSLNAALAAQTASAQALATSIDNAVKAIGSASTGPSQADVDAIAAAVQTNTDAINADKAKLDGALSPSP